MTTQPKLLTLPQFKLKMVNADFVVDEVYLEPRLTDRAEASHTYLWVEKENITTFALQQTLAGYFGLPVADVAAAGLKDEEAITRQIISLRTIISDEQIRAANAHWPDHGLKVTIRQCLGYGQQPVYPRLLHGNKFTVAVRNLAADVAETLAAYVGANHYFSFINYYDEQRFGPPGSLHNTHKIGQYLLANAWEEAYRAYLESGNDCQELERVQAVYDQSRSYEEALRAIMPAKLNFFISAYNSLIWNNRLSQELLRSGPAVQVELPYLGRLALPAGPTTSAPTSLSVPVEKRDWQSGQNRPTLKTRPVIINTPVYLLEKSDDTYHPSRQALHLSFYLPTGCYATMLIKQLLLIAQTDQNSGDNHA
jgi:tRNA pseudouridine13 synthase